jgi:GNAT superfamily N-acetyltransferase
MSADEVRHTARGLQHIIVPELAIAAEVDGRVVGVSFGLPDYNPRIKEINGRLLPFGFIHLLRNRQAIKRIRLISTNVLPEFQRMGVGLVLMHGLVPKAMEWGLQEAEFSWVLESNKLSYGALKKGGAKITKTYRLYDIEGEPSTPLRKADNAQSLVPVSQAPLEVRMVQNGRDLDRFIQLPWRIYAEDPQWVPPLIQEVKDFLNPRKHPFFQHGAAAQFIAVRGDETLGRILVSDDPLYNEQNNKNVGCFGMFECLDDRAAAQSLLDAASDWLRARGRTSIRGPIDYSINYPCGLLIDGFDTPPRFMMNHNRPYYVGLLESCGLQKAIDLYAWWFTDPLNLLSRWKEKAERLGRRGGITIRPFRTHDFVAEVNRCQTVYNLAMKDLWGFVKLTDAEFQFFAKKLKQMAMAEQVLLAEVAGEVVGFSITVPDVNEAIGPLNGRLMRYGLPIGLMQFLRHKRHIKTARMVVLDVLEKYRRRGIAELLILRTLDYGKNVVGYTGAELGWTQENNIAVNRTIEAVGARRYKTFRLYETNL